MTTSSQNISLLRQRMIDDMTMRKLKEKSQAAHVRAVKRLDNYLEHSPATATADELRHFQLHMVNTGVSSQTINVTIYGLRFFFGVTMDRIEVMKSMNTVRQPKRDPTILSIAEVKRLLDAIPRLLYQAALSVAYGAGLRRSEVAHLKVADIDSERMLIRVVQGKGSKDRNTMLSPSLLKLLRRWWCECRSRGQLSPNGWLFPGQKVGQPISTSQLHRECVKAAKDAGIDKHVSMHTLRHSFATHLLEQHEDIRVIQVLLGHCKLETTALYSRVATNLIREVKGPLESL